MACSTSAAALETHTSNEDGPGGKASALSTQIATDTVVSCVLELDRMVAMEKVDIAEVRKKIEGLRPLCHSISQTRCQARPQEVILPLRPKLGTLDVATGAGAAGGSVGGGGSAGGGGGGGVGLGGGLRGGDAVF